MRLSKLIHYPKSSVILKFGTRSQLDNTAWCKRQPYEEDSAGLMWASELSPSQDLMVRTRTGFLNQSRQFFAERYA